MIGGRFEAANREDFKDAVLLGTIETTPILNLQELTPEICRPFRYYRYVAPDSFPTSNMGLLEYLTDEYSRRFPPPGHGSSRVFTGGNKS